MHVGHMDSQEKSQGAELNHTVTRMNPLQGTSDNVFTKEVDFCVIKGIQVSMWLGLTWFCASGLLCLTE